MKSLHRGGTPDLLNKIIYGLELRRVEHYMLVNAHFVCFENDFCIW